MTITEEKIWNILETICDPEIPVLNIVEMGIVRKISIDDTVCRIIVTPTYSGCPAMKTIEDQIIEELLLNGIDSVEVKKTYSPAWTTDWLSDETKIKLREYGIAPPEGTSEEDFFDSILTKNITCPYCKSTNTKLTSEFGSTSCKSLHYCENCLQPFEHLKCI